MEYSWEILSLVGVVQIVWGLTIMVLLTVGNHYHPLLWLGVILAVSGVLCVMWGMDRRTRFQPLSVTAGATEHLPEDTGRSQGIQEAPPPLPVQDPVELLLVPVEQLSEVHREVLEVIRTEEPDAVIPLEPIAALKRVTVQAVQEAIQDLLDLRLIAGELHGEMLHLDETRVTCQLCDTAYSNPTRYYQCPLCYRVLCDPCGQQFVQPVCTSHPGSQTVLARMPLVCSTCGKVYYNLQVVQQHHHVCQTCGASMQTRS